MDRGRGRVRVRVRVRAEVFPVLSRLGFFLSVFPYGGMFRFFLLFSCFFAGRETTDATTGRVNSLMKSLLPKFFNVCVCPKCACPKLLSQRTLL